ncbi:HAD-IA family hydrolase [Candidatus Woesearchaeota archaeon]|nr:HAD-IA family hydrolase [Candidatus Woesearchaeota archaeon]
MIKNIIFDISGIFITSDEKIILEHYSKRFDIPYEKVKQAYESHFRKYEMGRLSKDKFTLMLFRDMGLKHDPHFWDRRIQYKKRYEEPFKLLDKLKKKYKVYFVSNEGKEYWHMVDERLKITKHFDGGIVSFQAGRRKPHTKIFSKLLRKYRLNADECIFIDDSAHNLPGAQKVGIRTIHYQNMKQLKADLKRFKI